MSTFKIKILLWNAHLHLSLDLRPYASDGAMRTDVRPRFRCVKWIVRNFEFKQTLTGTTTAIETSLKKRCLMSNTMALHVRYTVGTFLCCSLWNDQILCSCVCVNRDALVLKCRSRILRWLCFIFRLEIVLTKRKILNGFRPSRYSYRYKR